MNDVFEVIDFDEDIVELNGVVVWSVVELVKVRAILLVNEKVGVEKESEVAVFAFELEVGVSIFEKDHGFVELNGLRGILMVVFEVFDEFFGLFDLSVMVVCGW